MAILRIARNCPKQRKLSAKTFFSSGASAGTERLRVNRASDPRKELLEEPTSKIDSSGHSDQPQHTRATYQHGPIPRPIAWLTELIGVPVTRVA